MNRDTLASVLVALLAVLALGIGASALDSTPTTSGDTGRGGGDVGMVEGDRFDLGQPPTIVEIPDGIPLFALQLLAALALVAFFVGLYLLRDELGLRELGVIALGVLVFGVVLVLFYLWLGLFDSDGRRNVSGTAGGRGESAPALPGGGGSSGDAVQTLATDSPLLALVVGAVLVVGLLVFLRSTGDDSTPEPEPDSVASKPVTGLGRIAGRAADRITDDADPENEVYRAWHEMTDHLDVEHPHASTPTEFARAATDAGMAREDVDELTNLFISTRYGGSHATADREERAVAALRRIEDEYAEAP